MMMEVKAPGKLVISCLGLSLYRLSMEIRLQKRILVFAPLLLAVTVSVFLQRYPYIAFVLLRLFRWRSIYFQ